MTPENVLQALKDSEYLQGVPEDQLAFLQEVGEVRAFESGEPIFEPGDKTDHLLIVLSGRFGLYMRQNGNFIEAGEGAKGFITGVLPFSRMVEAMGKGEAKERTEILHVHRSQFHTLISEHYELATSLVHFMNTRIREFSKRTSSQEKMAALGKLSAGLAHELNNPASAIVRSSKELKKHLGSVPEKFKQTMKLNVNDEQVDAVNGLMHSKLEAGIQSLSLMEKTEREDDIADWLEERGADDGYELAENFVDYGFTIDDMESFAEVLAPEKLITVLGWVNSNLITERMVSEIQESSTRIAELVKSVKAFTHMDQAPTKELVDVRIGIRNTLTMLNHKVKRQQIEIVEDFEENFPNAEVFISQMNQVWTNLLDNSIDALEEQETQKIIIKGFLDGRFMKVRIIDNGPGIPDDIQSRIFEPFYTTKKQGKGTGLGLDVVQRIVQQHGGVVTVDSEPGRTEFEVCLPIKSEL